MSGSTWPRRAVIGSCLGLGFFLLYIFIPRNWDAILSSDGYFFADVSENAMGLREFVFGKPLQRHVLFSLIGHPLYVVSKGIFGSGGLVVPTALFGALGVVIFFALACSRLGSLLDQVLISLLFGFAATNLVYAGIPETYVPSGALVLASVLAWIHWSQRRQWFFLLLLFLSLTLVGLMNPVILGFLAVAYVTSAWIETRRFSHVLMIAMVCVLSSLVACAIQTTLVTAAMPHLTRRDTMAGSVRYLTQYGNLSNFLSAEKIGIILLNTFVTPLGALPVSSFKDAAVAAVYSRGFGSLFGYGHSFVSALFFALYVVFLGVAMHGRRSAYRIGSMTTTYLVCHILFFLWFNPTEAFLYSPGVLGLCLLSIFDWFGGFPARRRWILLGILVLVTAANNLSIVFSL